MTTQQVRNPFERGPYLQLATFCERVLHEADGVISLIRIVDVINHVENRPDAPPEMPAIRFPLTLVLCLKSGTALGRHDISITPEKPSGETLETVTTSIRLEGEARGANIISRIDIPYEMEGLYWFHVRYDGELLTKIPLELRYSRTVTSGASRG